MPNNFGGDQMHPAYNPTTELAENQVLVDNNLYTIDGGLLIEVEHVNGDCSKQKIADCPKQVKDLRDKLLENGFFKKQAAREKKTEKDMQVEAMKKNWGGTPQPSPTPRTETDKRLDQAAQAAEDKGLMMVKVSERRFIIVKKQMSKTIHHVPNWGYRTYLQGEEVFRGDYRQCHQYIGEHGAVAPDPV